jgi:alanyl-tRNA synthetase
MADIDIDCGEHIKHAEDLGVAASIATQAIANAAREAVRTVSEAAAQASRLVVHNAEETSRTLNTQRSSDHDAIVRISEKIDSLKADVKELKDGTSKRIDNLENDKLNIKESYTVLYKKAADDIATDTGNRLKKLEEGYAQMKMLGVVAIVILGIVEFFINKFVR